MLRFFRISPESPGPRRRQHDPGRRGGRSARLRADQDDVAERAGDRRAAAGGTLRRGRAACRARLGFVTARRSELPIDAEPRADVVVLDSIGELAQLYQVATAVFVGGSLVDQGGHNILEPAMFGKPIVFGPHMQNFQEIADAFITNGAAMQVQSERELDEALLTLVTDPVRRARLGAAARALVEANRGAKNKTLAVIADLLPLAGGTRPEAWSVPSDWCIDSRPQLDVQRGHGLAAAVVRARAVPPVSDWRGPVISVGNLSVGGSGKTPVVGYIARLLVESGERPAILTRGYGRRRTRRGGHGRVRWHRRSRRPRCVGRRAADAGPSAAGCRGRRRREPLRCAGRLAEERLGATVHVLDDGFQHLQIERTSICCWSPRTT